MFSFLEDLYLKLNDECAIAAFCDLTKAFDCVSHHHRKTSFWWSPVC